MYQYYFEGHQLKLYPTDLTPSDYVLSILLWKGLADNLLQDQKVKNPCQEGWKWRFLLKFELK